MIKILEQSTQSCLAVQFSGKVSGADYQVFLEALDERLAGGAAVNMVVEFIHFEFYDDFEAAKQDMKFGFGTYKHIHRAAFVGDQKWIEWFTRLAGPFTRAEEKHFPTGQLEEAFRWAAEK